MGLGPLQYLYSPGPVSSWRGGLELTHLGGCQKFMLLMHGFGLTIGFGSLLFSGAPTKILAIVGDDGSEVGEVVIDEIDFDSISSLMAMVCNLMTKSCSQISLAACS